jgi:hypothetical protein
MRKRLQPVNHIAGFDDNRTRRSELDSGAVFHQKGSMAIKDYPSAPAAPAADSNSTPNHVWAFDLGKASIGFTISTAGCAALTPDAKAVRLI